METNEKFSTKKHFLIQVLYAGARRPTTLVLPDYETFKIWHENKKDSIEQFTIASVDGIYVNE